MSGNQYNSFFDEIQERFVCIIENYIPYGIGGGGLKIRLIPKQMHKSCPHCGHGKTYVHEYRPREIHGGAFNGVPVTYTLGQVRRMCPSCGRTSADSYSCLPWGHGITDEAEGYILAMVGSMPMDLIARHLGLSPQTVADRAQAYAAEEQKIMLGCHYRYLSMDEVYIGRLEDGKHRIYWVLNDNSVPWKSNNIMIGIGRAKEDVVNNLKKLEHGGGVVAVSTDMWPAYREAIQEALPNAAIVIDRFHVMENAAEAINTARKNAGCPKKIKDGMKKDAQLFLKYWVKLTAGEMDLLDYYFSFDKKLEETYYLVQEFMDFYNLSDYDRAIEYLCAWETKLFRSGVAAEMKPFYDTLLNWLPYIMNYFIPRISNGRTEGKNNLLRQIDRMGFHYGLECLQACIYCHDRKQELEKWRRRQHWIELKLPKKAKVADVGADGDASPASAA
jgi:transposase